MSVHTTVDSLSFTALSSSGVNPAANTDSTENNTTAEVVLCFNTLKGQ